MPNLRCKGKCFQGDFYYIFLFVLCGRHAFAMVHMWRPEKRFLERVDSLLLPCESQGLNSSFWLWQQAPLPANQIPPSMMLSKLAIRAPRNGSCYYMSAWDFFPHCLLLFFFLFFRKSKQFFFTKTLSWPIFDFFKKDHFKTKSLLPTLCGMNLTNDIIWTWS